jgi:hypothetical protein
MKNKEIIKLFNSLEKLNGCEAVQLESLGETDVVVIIKGINDGSGYWSQETKFMRNPVPNMSPRKGPTYSKVAFDVHGKNKLFEPFVNFLLGAVKLFPNITLYVHDGEFGFSPVFGVRYLNKEFKDPYLIKFKQEHLSEKHYLQMINMLYSKENITKHKKSGIKEIRNLTSYEY